MAPKFIRKLKKKIQKVFEKKIKYDKLTDDGTPINDVCGNSIASPKEINLNLYAENITTFEAVGPHLNEQDNASSVENAKNNSGETDENWQEPKRPFDALEFAARPRTVTTENSELGTIIFDITEMGLEIETENNKYNAWEDILLMDPQENLVRSWSIQFPPIRNYAASKPFFYGSNPDFSIEKNVNGARQKMKNFIRKASHNARQSLYNLEDAFVENNFFIDKNLMDLSKYFQ